jgi:hypothetical protein
MRKFLSFSSFHWAEKDGPRGRKIEFHLGIVIPEKLRDFNFHTNNPDRFTERNTASLFVPDQSPLKKKKMGSLEPKIKRSYLVT